MKLSPTQSVSVFCGAQSPTKYLDLAYEVGQTIAESGYRTVTGGGSGMMAQVNRGAREAGGQSWGIAIYKDTVMGKKFCDHFEIHDDLIPRQQALIKAGNAFVALPGGLGTIFEVVELSLKKRFGLIPYETPVIFVTDYFLDLKITLEKMQNEGFIKDAINDLYYFARDAREMAAILKQTLNDVKLESVPFSTLDLTRENAVITS